jgi:hypothetical protein
MTLERIMIWVLAAIVVGLPTYGVLYSSLGAMRRLDALLLCSPLVGFLALLPNVHLPVLLFCNAFPVPIPRILGNREVPISVVVPFLMFAGYLARTAIMKSHSVRVLTKDKPIDAAMFITSLAVVLWIVIDRPSMASMGAETGGAWEAMMALSGVCAYWGARSLRNRSRSWRKLVLVTLGGAALGLVWTAVDSALQGRAFADFLSGCFFSTGWWFYGMALGVTVKVWYSPSRRFGAWPAYITAMLTIVNSLMSGYRSRILFGPLMTGAAFWCGRLRKSMMFFVLSFLGIAILLANTEVGGKLPDRARRVLSPVRIASERSILRAHHGAGEWGPSSPWRMALWKTAWSKIRERPLLGYGYAFSGALLYADTASAASVQDAIVSGLVKAGQFHTVPLNLTYYLGMPVACVFCFAWLLTFRRLLSLSSTRSGWYGALATGLLTYLIAVTGQALTTGTGIEFIAVCTVMGVYQAISPGETDAGYQAGTRAAGDLAPAERRAS